MSNYQYDLPFDIMDIANILNLRIRRPGRKSVYADCPFCGDTRGKLNLNLERNQFRCNYCGESGGAIAFYGKAHGLSNSEAYREICEILYGDANPKDYKAISKKKEKPDLPTNSELASVYDRNQTYEMLLSMLTLTDKHVEDLTKRGLTLEQIEKNGYRSTPAFGFDRLAKILLEKGCTIAGVPGFYEKTEGVWSLNFKSCCSGILIPYRTLSGMIQAFQIRLDKPFVDEKGRKTKYIWFSSVDEEKGVSSKSPAHFVGNPCDEDAVFVTEGALKADIASALSGRTFVAVAGTGCIDSLKEPFEIMKRNGITKVYECLDMDKTVNENVAKAAVKLTDMISEFGFITKTTKWKWDKSKPNENKGIDDMLLSKQKKELI